MAEHLVQLWIRSDDDPSGIDWQAWLPKSVQVEHVQTRAFPWQDVNSEALLRARIEDSINALCHLLKQTGKPDLDDITRRVVTNVVPRLHAVLNGENPYDD